MTQDTAPAAQRIGDADRDRAVTALQEHHVAGRLDRDEFDTRMTAALAARTQDDLEPLFVDLPRAGALSTEGSPAAAPSAPALSAPVTPAPSVPSPWLRYGAPVAASAIWPLTILACIMFGNWALMAVPIIVSMVLGRGLGRAPGHGCGKARALRR